MTRVDELGRWCGAVSGKKLKMHVSRFRMGQVLDGVGFRVRGCGGGVDLHGKRAYVAKISEWLGMVGLFIQGPVARNGARVSHVGKGGEGVGIIRKQCSE
jgi:hypothetical protein